MFKNDMTIQYGQRRKKGLRRLVKYRLRQAVSALLALSLVTGGTNLQVLSAYADELSAIEVSEEIPEESLEDSSSEDQLAENASNEEAAEENGSAENSSQADTASDTENTEGSDLSEENTSAESGSADSGTETGTEADPAGSENGDAVENAPAAENTDADSRESADTGSESDPAEASDTTAAEGNAENPENHASSENTDSENDTVTSAEENAPAESISGDSTEDNAAGEENTADLSAGSLAEQEEQTVETDAESGEVNEASGTGDDSQSENAASADGSPGVSVSENGGSASGSAGTDSTSAGGSISGEILAETVSETETVIPAEEEIPEEEIQNPADTALALSDDFHLYQSIRAEIIGGETSDVYTEEESEPEIRIIGRLPEGAYAVAYREDTDESIGFDDNQFTLESYDITVYDETGTSYDVLPEEPLLVEVITPQIRKAEELDASLFTWYQSEKDAAPEGITRADRALSKDTFFTETAEGDVLDLNDLINTALEAEATAEITDWEALGYAVVSRDINKKKPAATWSDYYEEDEEPGDDLGLFGAISEQAAETVSKIEKSLDKIHLDNHAYHFEYTGFGIYTVTTDDARLQPLTEQKLEAEIYTSSDYTTRTEEDTVITLSGMLPTEGTVRAYPVELDVADGIVLAAYDISIFRADGTLYEPKDENEILVEIDNPKLREALAEDRRFGVLHITEGTDLHTSEIIPIENALTEAETAEKNAELLSAAEEEYRVSSNATISRKEKEETEKLVSEFSESELFTAESLEAPAAVLRGRKLVKSALGSVVSGSLKAQNAAPLALDNTLADDNGNKRGSIPAASGVIDIEARFRGHEKMEDLPPSVSDALDQAVFVREAPLSFYAKQFSVYAIVETVLQKTITASDGLSYRITVSYDSRAGLPADAKIRAEEIKTDDADALRGYMQDTADTLGVELSSMTYTKLFDISIVDSAGTEYQPDENVSVTIELLDEEAEGVESLRVVHFDEANGPVELDASTESTSESAASVTFDTDGFSAFSLTDFSLTSRIINAIFGDRRLYENDDIILTGRMPLLGTVEATPVEVTIENEEVLVAYDIKIYANSLMKLLGITWQPSGDAIKVTVKSDALAGRTGDLSVYHFSDETADPEFVTNTQQEDSAVSFDADSFSAYAVTVVLEKTITATDGRTYKIEVSYDGNAGIPGDAYLEVSELSETDERYEEYIHSAADTLETPFEAFQYTKLFDISIVGSESGKHYQPIIDVDVSIRLIDAEKPFEKLQVVHFGEEPKELETLVTGDTVQFKTDGFSVYSVTDSTFFHTYRFYVPKNAEQTEFEEYQIYTDGENITTFTQIIKNEDEGLEVPQLPSIKTDQEESGSGNIAKSTFAGWYLDTSDGSDIQHPALSTDEFDFDNIPAVSETKEYHLYARFANFAYVIFHEQYNGSTSTWPITATRRGELTGDSPTTSIEISDVIVSYDDSGDSGSEDEGSAPVKAFRGWTTESGLNEDKTAALENADILESPFEISENTDLYPVFVHINWLTFVSGPSGSGATYYAPKFYYIDESISSFAEYIPVRRGYEFAGWYTGEGEDEDAKQLSDATGNLTTSTDLSGVEGLSWQDGKLVLSKNVTIYAKWNQSATTYTVVVWRQKIDDDKNVADDDKTYDFAESYVLSAITGATVNTTTTSLDYTALGGSGDYEHFHYNSANSDTNAVVQGNGSTVLNVYYDRDLITFIFNVNGYVYTETTLNTGTQYGSDDGTVFYRIYYRNSSWRKTDRNYGEVYEGTRYTRSQGWHPDLVLTGLYGQPLSKYEYSWPSTYTWLWEPDGDTLVPVRLEFSNDITAYRYGTYGNPVTMQYYFQETDGSEPDFDGLPNATRPYNNPTTTNPGIQLNMFSGMTPSRYKVGNGNWVTITDENMGTRFTVSADTKMYFTRDQKTLTFIDSYDNSTISSAKVLYGQALKSFKPSTDPISIRAGYEFAGWYADRDCTTRVYFDPDEYNALSDEAKLRAVLYETMPAANMSVYAKWDTKWYLIKTEPNGGEYPATSSYSTWFWKQYGTTELVTEYENTSRHFVESLNGTWYYAVRDRAYYDLTDEWEDREDDIPNRKAYYTQDINDDAIVDLNARYKEAQDAFRYANWFEVLFDESGNEIGERLYNFNTAIDHNMTLRLHWKQIGTYYIRYDAGDGTLDDADNNEDTYKILDSSDYSDHSDVVITRTAKAPEGYNFVGWTVHGADGTVYYPGQAFEFQSIYTVADGEKEVLILDAVYSRIGTAKIIYNSNGGTIATESGSVDYGAPTDGDAPDAITERISDTEAVIRNLINNSGITLSNGTGFNMENAELVGWNTKPDGSGEMFSLGGEYNVDTEEPVTLYAIWKVKVYFDKNKEAATWGGDWTADDFIYDSENNRYYKEVITGNPINSPVNVPASEDEDMFLYWSETRYTDSSVVAVPYDFTAPISDQLILYGFWGKIEVPLHAVDATNQELVNKDSEWLVKTSIHMDNATSEVDISTADQAASYTNVDPGQYSFFAAVSDSMDNIAESNIIKSVSYNVSTQKVAVTYLSDEHTADLPSGSEIYLVYWEKENLPIGYKRMNTDGELEDIDVSTSAPRTADNLGIYSLNESLDTPLSYPLDGYSYYAYAIGRVDDGDEMTDADLRHVTSSSDSDSSRPSLMVENTWRGYQYSTDDGETWVNVGYDIQLYVLYFESQPSIITLYEKTIGTEDDLLTEFNYHIKEIPVTITQTNTETQTYDIWSRSWSTSESTEWTTAGTSEGEPSLEYDIELSDNMSETITLFYSQTGLENGDWDEFWFSRTRTNTRTIVTHKVVIVQNNAQGFVTTHEGSAGVSDGNYTWTYTADEGGGTVEVTYTNKHIPISFPVHVALIEGGQFKNNDSLRSETPGDYIVTVNQLEGVVDLEEGSLPHIFTGDKSIYTFAGIIYGTEDSDGTITVGGNVNSTNSVKYGQMYPEDANRNNIYEMYLNGYNALLIDDTELNKNYNIYFVYYEMPRIYFVKEEVDGTLTPIERIQRNGADVQLNGKTVAQGEKLNVTTDPFVISQSSSNAYRIPPDLDGRVNLSLDYIKLATGPAEVGYLSDLEAVTTDKVMKLQVIDSQVKYSLDDGETWNVFENDPTVYAIYKEKGFDLTIKKTVDGPGAEPGKTFTLTLTSDALKEVEYTVKNNVDNTNSSVNASVNDGVGSLTLTVQNGSDITVIGLPEGNYTVQETAVDNCTLTAKLDGNTATVTNNRVTVQMKADHELSLTNTITVAAPTGYTSKKRTFGRLLLMSLLLGSMAALPVWYRKRRNGGGDDEM